MKSLPETLQLDENVTRVEVIDRSGRVYVNLNAGVIKLLMQDEGRTLKIFIAEPK